MPMPLWFGHINKRIFNPLELRRGKRPVITHIGRSSGKEYHTPLDAHPVEGGYIFILVYGSDSDWVKNILASGRARLQVGDNEYELTSPRVVSHDVAFAQLGERVKEPPKRLNVTEFLQMDLAA